MRGQWMVAGAEPEAGPREEAWPAHPAMVTNAPTPPHLTSLLNSHVPSLLSIAPQAPPTPIYPLLLFPPLPPQSSSCTYKDQVCATRPHGTCRRLAGAKGSQLQVVAEAKPGEFVGTKRLEEDWPGYSWRSILSPSYFRFPPRRRRRSGGNNSSSQLQLQLAATATAAAASCNRRQRRQQRQQRQQLALPPNS